MRIILASKSPRRKELMSLITNNFEVMVSNGTEIIDNNKSHPEQVKEIAMQKAKNVFEKIDDDCIVLGSDTFVVVDDEILLKPTGVEDATRMLKLISNKEHEVLTGICIIIRDNGKITTYAETDISKIHVQELSDEEIKKWISTGKAIDKAGAYGIQDEFGVYIDRIEGSFYSIMGLPIHRVYQIIKNYLWGEIAWLKKERIQEKIY